MLGELFSAAVDFIIPPRRTDKLVRTFTLTQLHTLGGEEPLPYHDPRVQALVWELKYFANKKAAALAAAYLAETVLAAAAEELGKPLLIPVPMHAARKRERGHNQTELLCKATLPLLERAVEYRADVLTRIKNTPTQQGLERSKRLKNVQDSMRAKNIHGRTCIVVDDVTTTGATLEECKRALKEAGARSVHTVALARS
ncbi:MAG: phosphoribosyltransferase family protein [Patescibacteria group bacterium]